MWLLDPADKSSRGGAGPRAGHCWQQAAAVSILQEPSHGARLTNVVPAGIGWGDSDTNKGTHSPLQAAEARPNCVVRATWECSQQACGSMRVYVYVAAGSSQPNQQRRCGPWGGGGRPQAGIGLLPSLYQQVGPHDHRVPQLGIRAHRETMHGQPFALECKCIGNML